MRTLAVLFSVFSLIATFYLGRLSALSDKALDAEHENMTLGPEGAPRADTQLVITRSAVPAGSPSPEVRPAVCGEGELQAAIEGLTQELETAKRRIAFQDAIVSNMKNEMYGAIQDWNAAPASLRPDSFPERVHDVMEACGGSRDDVVVDCSEPPCGILARADGRQDFLAECEEMKTAFQSDHSVRTDITCQGEPVVLKFWDWTTAEGDVSRDLRIKRRSAALMRKAGCDREAALFEQ